MINNEDTENEDTFVNINNFLEQKYVFQIQLNNNELNVKCIGKSSNANNIIICKDIGPNKNISICSVIYFKEELDNCIESGGIFDLVKLYEKITNDVYVTTSLCIQTDNLEFNKNFKIFIISEDSRRQDYIKHIDYVELNKSNIIEFIIDEHKKIEKIYV